MDKCIKVLIPTGEVIVEWDEDCENYFPKTDYSELKMKEYADGEIFHMNPSVDYDGWVETWIDGDLGHFKVIAQYGDEFPV